MNRRSFFSKIRQVVCAVALAPQIAFGTIKPRFERQEEPKILAFWLQTSKWDEYLSDEYRAARDKIFEDLDNPERKK